MGFVTRFWIFVSSLWCAFFIFAGIVEGQYSVFVGYGIGGLTIWWFLYWVIGGAKE